RRHCSWRHLKEDADAGRAIRAETLTWNVSSMKDSIKQKGASIEETAQRLGASRDVALA
ncbi:hypothetical protein PIB30_093157, partial [Stylosanthes scabra]|nr:hypothetical protein [Stylosanthes scabra]